LESANSRLENLARSDGLTGLANHRTFQEQIRAEVDRSRRHDHHLSLLLMDIDHFKAINDTYGHPVGDSVLAKIARAIEGQIRISDTPARYGGEEFTVILPETGAEGAEVIAERIRVAVESMDDLPCPVTVSIGVIELDVSKHSVESLIAEADAALYAAKRSGRNRVVLA
jgi:diguanylate cyclase (GGDEF)-like protein